MNFSLRLLYLYLFSFVGLLILVFGCISLVEVGLKAFIFTEADGYEIYPEPVKIEGEQGISPEEQRAMRERDVTRQRQRQLSTSLSMIAVGLPLYGYHWRLIQKENKKK